MSIVIRTNSIREVFIHIFIALTLLILLGILFFYNVLPIVTRHNETITVPNLIGVSLEGLEDKLKKAGFQLVVQDTIYDKNYRLNTIVEQRPIAGTPVKEGRKIYVIITPKTTPKVKVPDLRGMSYQMAMAKIRTLQLEVGAIRFKPDIAADAILGQEIDGKPLKPGEYVTVGTRIDLVIGSGVGDEEFDVPELEGLTLEEAKEILEANNLQLGHVTEVPDADEPAGIVVQQTPPARLEADRVPLYDKDGKPLTKAEREKIRKELEAKSANTNPDEKKKKKKYKKGEFDPRPRNKIRAGEIVDLKVSTNKNYKPTENE
ncbi:MAG: PASTA domain-containing protein [Raineya sp.]|nr:PASTA domain-containing protein [Raineya sp.]MDW8296556.1 PASTA domain-containing protein [Raineya sp.]